MNPMDLGDPEPSPRRAIPWRKVGHGLCIALRWLCRTLLTDPRDWGRGGLPVEDGTLLARFLRGLLYRLAFIPVLVMLAVCALVYCGTHPRIAAAEIDPFVQGVYYDPVNFISEDGWPLDAWLVPVVDARRILADGDSALHRKWPAVVLVHGHYATRSQMLPLVKPLHEEGWIVLVLAVRGSATANPQGRTFGLNESEDVRAALAMLRRRPFVDARRLAVVGVETGANAALLAAERDPAPVAIVLDAPVSSAEDAIERFIAPPQPYLKWLGPLCKWAFDLAYAKDIDEIDMMRHTRTLAGRASVVNDGGDGSNLSPAAVGRILTFLREAFAKVPPA
ncbi:MAG: hypothetical protein ABR964_15520 [Tepidisphaeraceae bacterium]